MKPALCLLLAVLACGTPLRAQDTAAPDATQGALLSAVGSSAAQAVYATHMAVNTLSDAWVHKTYTDEVALTLAGGYEGGIGAMTDQLGKLVEDSRGLSDGDLSSLTELVECGRLVIAQITAFKGLVKTGEAAKAKIFEAKRIAAQQKIFTFMGIDDGAGDAPEPNAGGPGLNHIEFEIVEAKMPQGGPGQKGKVVFSRSGPERAYTVDWTYEDGTADQGLAVPFPDSGHIAVGFGPDVLGVAIYKLDGQLVDGRWALYEEDAEIGAYTMKQGENDTVYTIEGLEEEGTFQFEEMEAGAARLAWKYPSGELAGYGVAVGNYLAAVSVTPGGKSGVAIYVANPENKTAEGKWTLESTLGTVGEETYRFIEPE